MGAGDGDGPKVHGEVAGDGVVIEIVFDGLRDVAEQTFIDKLDGEIAQAVDLVKVDVEAVWIVVAKSKAVSDFADRDNGPQRL